MGRDKEELARPLGITQHRCPQWKQTRATGDQIDHGSGMIHVENDEPFPVLAVFGEVDLASVEDFVTSFSRLASVPILVVSLEKTKFIDSSVLGVLVKEYDKRGGRLVIVVPETAPAYRVLTITGLASYFSVVADRARGFERAATMRDIPAASFSRDGVNTPEASGARVRSGFNRLPD